jgi:hypothetical protein
MSRFSRRGTTFPPTEYQSRTTLSSVKHDAWAVVTGGHRPGTHPSAPSGRRPRPPADLPLPERPIPDRRPGILRAAAAVLSGMTRGGAAHLQAAAPQAVADSPAAVDAPPLQRGHERWDGAGKRDPLERSIATAA